MTYWRFSSNPPAGFHIDKAYTTSPTAAILRADPCYSGPQSFLINLKVSGGVDDLTVPVTLNIDCSGSVPDLELQV